MIVEGIGTFVLVLAVLAVALDPRASQDWAPLAIGTTLGFVVMVIGPLTGRRFNPARWFGPALVDDTFGGVWPYLVGPLRRRADRGGSLPLRDRAGERPPPGRSRRQAAPRGKAGKPSRAPASRPRRARQPDRRSAPVGA